MKISVKYPREMVPGDSIYVNKALQLPHRSAPQRLDFLVDNDICIMGAYASSKNSFVIPRGLREPVGLVFVAAKEAPPDSVKHFGLVLYERRVIWWKLLLVLAFVGSSVTFLFLQAFFELTYGSRSILEVAQVSIPIVVLLALSLIWHRAMDVVQSIVRSDVIKFEPSWAVGVVTDAGIKIVDSRGDGPESFHYETWELDIPSSNDNA